MKGCQLPSRLYFLVIALCFGVLEQSQAFVAPSAKTSRLHHDASCIKHKPTVLYASKKVTTTLAGRMWPFLKKFKITPGKSGKQILVQICCTHTLNCVCFPVAIAKEIVSNVLRITQWQELLFFCFLAFGSKPLAQLSLKDLISTDTSDETEEEARKPFDKYKRFAVSTFLSEIGKLALTVYAFDVVCVILSTLGFEFVNKWGLANVFAKSAYTAWGLQKLLLCKKIALCKIFKVREDDMGKVEVFDRIINGLAIAVVSLILLDWLSVKMGSALKGVYALGSIGTVAFTLGSQKIISQFLSGMALGLSNKMYVGDVVSFGDGTTGKVMKLGWMECILMGSDNVLMNVRNPICLLFSSSAV